MSVWCVCVCVCVCGVGRRETVLGELRATLLFHFQLLSTHPDRPVLLSLQFFPLRSVGGKRMKRQSLPGQEESLRR